MAKKKNYYVVWAGHETGIFPNWEDCQKQVKGFSGAKYKGYKTKAEAETAFESEYVNPSNKKSVSKPKQDLLEEIHYESISVDAACSGNPGIMEYQGVNTQDGKKLFFGGPYHQGTNNIGEFLALVHGLSYLKKNNSHYALYSDSQTAMSWVKKKKCRTKLSPTSKDKTLFELIERAEIWLKTHSYSTQILKWETEKWGEIPADFGRK